MKILKAIYVIFFINVLLFSQGLIQDKDFDYTSYGQMIYWKTLKMDEKKVFLYAYLYRTNEILNLVKENRKMNLCSEEFKRSVADPVFKIFSALDEKKKEDLIYWIGTFCKSDFNKEKTSYDAFEKVKTGKKSLYDIYKDTFE